MKASTVTTTTLAVRPVLFSPEEELALVGFLAGYSGLTREAYALDLRQYVAWCTERHLALFGARRADIESFGRHLESLGRARATIARRLCTIAAFYRYAEEEGLIAISPAVHVRRPRLDYESHATGLDRNEVGATARRRRARQRPRPRADQPAGAQRAAGLRSHRCRHRSPRSRTRPSHPDDPAQRRQGRHHPARARAPPAAIDLAVGERCEGPIFLGADGERLDRHAAGRIVRRIARRAGITKRVGPHTLRHAFITAALDAGVPLRDVQEAASHADPRTTMRYDRARVSLDRHATYIVATFIAGAAR